MESPSDLIVDNVAILQNAVVAKARFYDSEYMGLTLNIPFIYATKYSGDFSYSIGKDHKTGLPILKEDFQYAVRQHFADSIIYIDNTKFDLGYNKKYQENIIEGSLEGLSLIALYDAVYTTYLKQTNKNFIITLYLTNQLNEVAAELEEVEAKAQELYSKQELLRSYVPRV